LVFYLCYTVVVRFSKSVWFYITGVVALGLGLAIWRLWGIQFSRAFVLSWFVFGLLHLICELYEVQLVPGHTTSAAIAVGIGAVLVGGPQLGLLVVLTSSTPAEFFLRRKFFKKDPTKYAAIVLFNVSQLAIAVVIAGLLFQALGGGPPPYKSVIDFLRAIFTFFAFVVFNAAIVSGVVHFARGVDYWRHFLTILRARYVQVFSLGILAILIAIVHSISPWYTILMLAPLFVVQISLREHLKLREQAKAAFEKIAAIIHARDVYTGQHSEEVAELAVKLARALRLPEEEVERIEAAARVHDLGKIAVPDPILLKPGPLDEKEWEVVKKHPVIGAEILAGLEIYKDCIDIIRHEHEHWDGTGYPDGLKGEQIPLGARIIAVADVWHALLSDRPYRKAYSKEEARKIMQDMAGKVLDPNLVELFLKILE